MGNCILWYYKIYQRVSTLNSNQLTFAILRWTIIYCLNKLTASHLTCPVEQVKQLLPWKEETQHILERNAWLLDPSRGDIPGEDVLIVKFTNHHDEPWLTMIYHVPYCLYHQLGTYLPFTMIKPPTSYQPTSCRWCFKTQALVSQRTPSAHLIFDVARRRCRVVGLSLLKFTCRIGSA